MSKRWKIFVFTPRGESWDGSGVYSCYDRLRKEGCEIVIASNSTKEEFLNSSRDADVLMGALAKTPITREVFENSCKLRIVAKYIIGVDDIDMDAATSCGILVTNSPIEYIYKGVAESTVAMMLAMLKKLPLRDKHTRIGLWRRDHSIRGIYVQAKEGHVGITIGFLGFGRIAREVARLLQPWSVRMITYSPHVPRSIVEQAGVTLVELDTLLEQSDVLSIHTSLTPEKRHMIGKEQFNLMKRSAYVVNTARGAVLDEQALVDALKERIIAGAALDCYEQEPIDKDNPLLKLDNVLLSPHCSPSNENVELQTKAVNLATDNVLKALEGQIPTCVVNPEAVSKWKQRFA